MVLKKFILVTIFSVSVFSLSGNSWVSEVKAEAFYSLGGVEYSYNMLSNFSTTFERYKRGLPDHQFGITFPRFFAILSPFDLIFSVGSVEMEFNRTTIEVPDGSDKPPQKWVSHISYLPIELMIMPIELHDTTKMGAYIGFHTLRYRYDSDTPSGERYSFLMEGGIKLTMISKPVISRVREPNKRNPVALLHYAVFGINSNLQPFIGISFDIFPTVYSLYAPYLKLEQTQSND